MSDSEETSQDKNTAAVLYQASITSAQSAETPMSQWSSLLFEPPILNKKRLLAAEGLYEPGSGEICTKYIAMSDSAMLRHPYYNYPAVLYPGIKEALFDPDPLKVYEDDGQELYLDVCKEMRICPVRDFHRSLLDKSINLRYYGVNPVGVRAMVLALSRNRTVESLDLTDNWLDDDACYHLGRLLVENSTLIDINLYGCRIGPGGLRRLCHNLSFNRTLKSLDLSYNQLGDAGEEFLCRGIEEAAPIERLNLSHNSLTVKSAQALSAALEYNNRLTHLDLSWNNLFSPATAGLINRLGTSTKLVELNLAWNALAGDRIGKAIKNLMKIPTLQHLDLSNNRFCAEAINAIVMWLWKAKKLLTLNLSSNPMSPHDAYLTLSKMLMPAVKIRNLWMDNILVGKDFIELLGQVKQMPSRTKFEVTYGGVLQSYEVKEPDYRDLLLRRCEFIALKPKKKPMDIAMYLMAIYKENPAPVAPRELGTLARAAGIALDDDLMEELAVAFPGPRNAKGLRLLNLDAVVEYVKRLWPDTKLPLTPPPTPPPEPAPPSKKGKGSKGKKK